MKVKIFPKGSSLEEIINYIFGDTMLESEEIPTQYGCECNSESCWHNHEGNIPAATAPVPYVIKRDGKLMKVCTRCNLPDDEIVELLVDKRRSNPEPYHTFDPFGFLTLTFRLMKITEEVKKGPRH